METSTQIAIQTALIIPCIYVMVFAIKVLIESFERKERNKNGR